MKTKLDRENLSKLEKELSIPKIHYFEETDSTNEQGLKLAAEGAPEFTLLIAERQTAGRGRMGRRWVTGEGTSLAFSMILRPTSAEIPRMSLFSLMGGLAVCRAIEATCGQASPQVKWPNDVLLEKKKTAGILAETNWQGDKLTGLVLGIGINIFEGSVPPAKETQFPATCVQSHCSKQIDRNNFLAVVLHHIIQLRPTLLESAFFEDYSRHLAFVEQEVFLKSNKGNPIKGILTGIGQDGQLVLRDEDGNKKSYPIGDLHLRLK